MKRILLTLLLLLYFPFFIGWSFAFWIWTPETNKWINPKYVVKQSPQEQLDYGLAFYSRGRYDEAIREFRKLLKCYPKAREAAEAQYYIGVCLQKQGKLYKAFKNYQLVIDKYPFSDRFKEIIKREYEIGKALLEGCRRKNKFMDALIGTDYNVIDVFRTVIKNDPYGKLAASAQYKIALYLKQKGVYQEARDEFEKVVNDYPESKWARAAKYQIAMTDAKMSTAPQYDQMITKAAVEGLKEFVKENPDAVLSKKAKKEIDRLRDKEAENNFLVAKFYEKQKNFRAAKIYYQTVVDEYKDTKWAVKALKKIHQLTVNQ